MEWKKLSIREKIGQTVIWKADPEEHKRICGTLEDFQDRYPVGGYFVGGEIIKHAKDGAAKVLNMTQEYRQASKHPLVFCADMESGGGKNIMGLTELPRLMALGASGSTKAAYDFGKVTALDARSVGVNWTFSPVVDLNQNPYNTITNIRSIGDDAEAAIPLLEEVIRGMQEWGVAATAKHFPGDGIDHRDQHLLTTSNTLGEEKWWEHHGRVFQKMVDTGVYTIMAGHIALPFYQKYRVHGRCLPATLSEELMTKLLKKEMGFEGVIVTDALVMGGFLGWYERTQAEIEAFKAGADMMLWPTLEYIDGMERAVRSGEVSMDRLDDAVVRIWTLKKRLGLFEKGDEGYRPIKEEEEQYRGQVADEIAEKSITLLRDRKNQLPLEPKSSQKMLVIAIAPDERISPYIQMFIGDLEKRGIQASLKKEIRYEELAEIQHQFDRILYIVSNPLDSITFGGKERAAIWASLSCAVDKSIVISLASPYFGSWYFEAAPTYINTYSFAPCTIHALGKALFGEIPFQGRSPVRLYP